MSLKDKYKTDANAASEGVWVDFVANSDGTIPGFKLARMSKHNKKYTAAARKFTERYTGEDGLVDFDSLPEEVAEKALLEVFITTVLLDWRNIQPDDNGVSLPFSVDAARELLGSEDWRDLYDDLNAKARKASIFRQKSMDASAKNS